MKSEKLNAHNLLWYFTVFSILGLIVETIFCYITEGIWQSRKGFVIGPFCPIYGVGAVCLIAILDKYKNQDWKIFVFGGIAGCVIEYVISYAIEAINGGRYWDYANESFNLNGRICLLFTVYWGILAVVLMKYIKLQIDKYINKISLKKVKLIDTILFIFFIIDLGLTIWAGSSYQNRVQNAYYGIETKKTIKSQIEETIFSNEIMKTIFPNLRIRDENEDIIFIKDMII